MNDLVEVEIISPEHESLAQAMLEHRGNLGEVSRMDSCEYNAMALRVVVKDNPQIRVRYHELLKYELEESGLHIAERILKMVELQDVAFGGEFIDGMGNKQMMPADPMTVINLSKEISRLIAEGKGQNMSEKAAVMIANKEDAAEILSGFLNS